MSSVATPSNLDHTDPNQPERLERAEEEEERGMKKGSTLLLTFQCTYATLARRAQLLN